jgi:alcohol dehydrogenase class IV
MVFEFATANRIIFGLGAISSLPTTLTDYGERALLLAGFSNWQNTALPTLLERAPISWQVVSISGEPTVADIQNTFDQAKQFKPEVLIGFGGGSAIDTAKAVSALLTNPGDIYDYLEVIGKGKPLTHDPLPVIAVPTTSGTGSEVTRNAVIGSPEHNVKVSLRSRKMIPDCAIVDPELTIGLPPEPTAYTGLDAMTQVLEPYVSHLSNPITDLFCREGIQRAGRSLQIAFHNGENIHAREDMSFTSLCGGLALANAKLGAVHGIAGPFGGMFKSPHGAVCGRLLPAVMETNINALRQRDPDSRALGRYVEAARLLIGDPAATAEDAVQWVYRIVQLMEIPGLSAYGFTPQNVPDLIEKSKKASSMKGNPIELLDSELAAILIKAL